jgi:hypothetical protein
MFTILGWIVFGAFAGWLANAIMGKQGSGCMVNQAPLSSPAEHCVSNVRGRGPRLLQLR